MKVPEFDKHLKKAGGHIGRNVVEITIKMKTIVRKPLMIKTADQTDNKTNGDKSKDIGERRKTQTKERFSKE